ncbi:uncharacterized protein HHUB_4329 (plasmid) [Halobacterium hubeiense]|uniref:Uncharacterized protein n=1 Tax=Halobacterium hubeiense TaxID=1407499 RepID=A0A0U5H8V0_9EURY|nr:hypothetical protein [Halobacterium hubeiense]CQH64233.1 uncharacterized protein HHUB_4329 [Halobacterium hubeiense]
MPSPNKRFALTTAAGVLNTATLHWWAIFVIGMHGPGPRTTLATQIGAWSFWIIGGFLIGAIPIHLYFEYNLLTAPLLTILLTAYCFADRLGGSAGEFTVFYLAAWPVFLAVIGVIAAIEYYVRLR